MDIRFVQFTTIYGGVVFINPAHVASISSKYIQREGESVRVTTIHMVGETDEYFSVPWNPVETIERLKGAI